MLILKQRYGIIVWLFPWYFGKPILNHIESVIIYYISDSPIASVYLAYLKSEPEWNADKGTEETFSQMNH